MSSRLQSSSRSPPTPKTIKLTPHALLSLPYRLTHPPPPQPKSSSWGITPKFDVRLDQILDRKHLPPLGLKDFEEWVLHIDCRSECLYFILWLREYKLRYTAWRRQSKLSSPIRCSSNPDARTYCSPPAPPPPNPALIQFFMRAKQTFLTQYALYALPLPLDLLAPFYSSLDPPGSKLDGVRDQLVPATPPSPPDPAIFGEIEERVSEMLQDSLNRFVVATFHNVGMPRAYCGCAGGTVIGLTGSAPILLANFLTGGSRWWRFSALPGLWLGMTIVISAMYGVCMMIYVFGDLRQLRSFELARLPDSVSGTPSAKTDKDTKSKSSLGLLTKTKMASVDHSDQKDDNNPPLPPQMQENTTAESTIVPESPTSRTPPPKARLNPPTPAYMYTHIHTSSRAQSSHAHMQSMSSASTSYSMKDHSAYLSPSQHIYDGEDEYSSCGSEYDSEDEPDSDSDASSNASHVSATEAPSDVGLPGKAAQRRRQTRRRRCREPKIHISDAFYDEEPSPEGPAMGPISEGSRRNSVWGDSCEGDIGTGATFIHPFRWDDAEEPTCAHDIESQAWHASVHQRVDAFDFDGLPRRAPWHSRANSFAHSVSPMTPTFPPPPVPPPTDPEKQRRGVHFASDVGGRTNTAVDRSLDQKEITPGSVRKFLANLQEKCGPRNVVMYMLGERPSTPTIAETDDMCERSHQFCQTGSQGPLSPTSTLGPLSVVWPPSSGYAASEKTATSVFKTETTSIRSSWRKRVKRMLQVPAFASPLTPVLNPVVTRGQWEIVVRSAMIALILSAAIIGALVGAPETSVV